MTRLDTSFLQLLAPETREVLELGSLPIDCEQQQSESLDSDLGGATDVNGDDGAPPVCLHQHQRATKVEQPQVRSSILRVLSGTFCSRMRFGLRLSWVLRASASIRP